MKLSHVFEIKQRDQNMFYLHLHYCRYSNAVLWQKCEFNIRVFVENQWYMNQLLQHSTYHDTCYLKKYNHNQYGNSL